MAAGGGLSRRRFLGSLGAGGLCLLGACAAPARDESERSGMSNLERAELTYRAARERFAVPGQTLFYEHVAAKPDDRAVAYLWPYSGMVSAAAALAAAPGRGQAHLGELERLLAGLEAYWDGAGDPPAYDSYIRAEGGGQKFYDDNEWLGMEFVHAHRLTGKAAYLERARAMFAFALSGWDEAMGGGIYWRQGDPATKNSCSNGPAAVLAMLLHGATGEAAYLEWAQRLLAWMARLKSPETGVYWDSLGADGTVDKRTFTYNTGTPIHAHALLYAATGAAAHLEEARALAAASLAHFYRESPLTGVRVFPDTPWFNAVLLRGYRALYAVDPARDPAYLEAMGAALEHAWEQARAEDGSFAPDMAGAYGVTDPQRWLLDQAAMAELYALAADRPTGGAYSEAQSGSALQHGRRP